VTDKFGIVCVSEMQIDTSLTKVHENWSDKGGVCHDAWQWRTHTRCLGCIRTPVRKI